MTDPKYLKRPGASGRGQQVFKHWDFASERERQVTLDENDREIHDKDGALARDTDHETSAEAARSISGEEATRLENMVATATWNAKHGGLTWDEAARITGLDKASVSPRWKSLRHRRLIAFALRASNRPGRRRSRRNKSQRHARSLLA